MVDRGPLIVKHFSIIIYIEQMIGCWGCCLTLAESARQLVHHLKYVVHHNEHHLSIGGKIGHSEVVANLSLGCCDWCLLSISIVDVLQELCHYVQVHMADLQVVNVPQDCALFPINCLIHDA